MLDDETELMEVHSSAVLLLNENLVHFPKCKELKDTVNAESVLSFAKYESHLELLLKEFHERYPDFSSFEEHFASFSALFTSDIAKVEESLQMELLEMHSHSTLRAKYFEVGIAGSFRTFLRGLQTPEGLQQGLWQCCSVLHICV